MNRLSGFRTRIPFAFALTHDLLTLGAPHRSDRTHHDEGNFHVSPHLVGLQQERRRIAQRLGLLVVPVVCVARAVRV